MSNPDITTLREEVDKSIKKITEVFSEELVVKSDPASINTLREQGAKAESYGIVLANWRRQLSQVEDRLEGDRLAEIKKEEREKLATGEIKKPYTVDEKKIMLQSKTAAIRAYSDYLEDVQDLVKRRCSLFQTILNSLTTEQKSQWSSDRLEVK